jgi:hypothetical protein
MPMRTPVVIPAIGRPSTRNRRAPISGGMPAYLRRTLPLLLVAVLALAWAKGVIPGTPAATARAERGLRTTNGDTVALTPAQRAAGFAFAPGVGAADRAWILDAVASARPQARRLIAAVDGVTAISTYTSGADGGPIGLARQTRAGFTVAFDVRLLDGERIADRRQVVLHELGHVIDFALIPAALDATLDAGIPASAGDCNLGDGNEDACKAPAERIADTFAKWAAGGAVSAAGAGYAIPAPASLEDWGAPLLTLPT